MNFLPMFPFSSPFFITCGKDMALEIAAREALALPHFCLSANLTSKLVLLIPLPHGGKEGPLCQYLACYDDGGLSCAVRGHPELD